jgi:hypothetical protein
MQGDNGTNTASAMQAVMAVAIETVNTVVETAMTTVNKMTLVTLEQLQSANAQHQWQACGPPFAPVCLWATLKYLCIRAYLQHAGLPLLGCRSGKAIRESQYNVM